MHMKQLFTILAIVIAGAAHAQKLEQGTVPTPVLNAFQQQFKDAAKAEWEKKAQGYTVEFEINKVDHKAWFDASGKITRHDQDIRKADLPAAIQQQLSSQFAGYTAKDPEKRDEGGKISYKVELKKQGDDRKVVFSPDGKVISNTAD